MTTRIGAAARHAAGILAVLLVLGVPARPPAPAPAHAAALVRHEPAAAAAFVAAYARGDAAGAERVASPLYRAEWERRGASAAERAALLPPPGALEFRYAGGVRVDGGGQLLYAVRATARGGRPALSVWRADTDDAGRVVWLELVWLFSDAVERVEPVGATADTGRLPLPPEAAALGPVVLVGVRSAGGSEGYYGLGLPAAAGPPVPAGFVAVDADGGARHVGWSYGEVFPAGG